MKTLRLAALIVPVLFMLGCGDGRDAERSTAPHSADDSQQTDTQNANEDRSEAPGGEQEVSDDEARAAHSYLRSNQVRTRHLLDGTVTAGKIAFAAVTVTVAAAATTGSSAADTTLAGGILIGCTPAGNQDVFLDNAVLNADGSITLTTGAAAVAANTYRCVAWRPNAQGVT